MGERGRTWNTIAAALLYMYDCRMMQVCILVYIHRICIVICDVFKSLQISRRSVDKIPSLVFDSYLDTDKVSTDDL